MTHFISKIINALKHPQSLGANVIFILLQTVLETGLITLLMLVIMKQFGPELFGRLGVILAGVQLVTMTCDGIFVSLIRTISAKFEISEEEGRKIAGAFCAVTILVGGIIGLLVGGISLIGVVAGYSDYILWVLLGTSVAISRIGKSAAEATLRSLRDFRTPLLTGGFFAFITAIVGFALVMNGFRVSGYLALISLTQLGNVFVLLICLSQKSGLHPIKLWRDNRSGIYEYFSYSKFLIVRGFIAFLYFQVNVPLVAFMVSAADAGYYRFLNIFMSFSPLILSSLLNGFAPRIIGTVERSKEETGKLLGKMYYISLLSTIPFAILFLAAPFWIKVFYADFSPIAAAFVLFIPVTIVQAFGYAASILLTHGGFPKTTFYLAFIPALLNIVATVVGIQLAGLYGGIIGAVIIYIGTNLATCYYAHKNFGIPFKIAS